MMVHFQMTMDQYEELIERGTQYLTQFAFKASGSL